MRSLRILRLTLLLAAAATAGGYFYPPLRLFAIAALGRSPACPLPNALQAAEHLRLLTAAKDRILASSRLLEKDPAGYHLWQTPAGPFWIPAGNDDDFVLPFNLAEQERKIYGESLRPGDVVLDCGANIGVFTREALRAGARGGGAGEPAPPKN
jgi:hypothetical protein